MVNSQPQTVLITGASGGIGYEFAKLFAKDHYSLVLVARNAAKLTQIANELQRQFGVSVKTVVLDLISRPLRERCLTLYSAKMSRWIF